MFGNNSHAPYWILLGIALPLVYVGMVSTGNAGFVDAEAEPDIELPINARLVEKLPEVEPSSPSIVDRVMQEHAQGRQLHETQEGVDGGEKRKKKLAIISMYFGTSAYLKDLTYANKKAYAAHHGYDFFDAYENEYVKGEIAEAMKSNHTDDMLFMKLKGILHFLPEYEWIFWSDADALFLNFSKPLLEYTTRTDRDIIFAAGPPHSRTWRGVINSGHFFVKNSDFGKMYLEETWEHRVRPCMDPKMWNGWLDLCPKRCCAWGEQGAFMDLLLKNPRWLRSIYYVGFREFNSHFPFWGEGDLVVHLPGQENDLRIKVFNEFLDRMHTDDGTVDGIADRTLPAWLRPEHSIDHVPNMDYSKLNNH